LRSGAYLVALSEIVARVSKVPPKLPARKEKKEKVNALRRQGGSDGTVLQVHSLPLWVAPPPPPPRARAGELLHSNVSGPGTAPSS
jgi:hypothetical protein